MDKIKNHQRKKEFWAIVDDAGVFYRIGPMDFFDTKKDAISWLKIPCLAVKTFPGITLTPIKVKLQKVDKCSKK